jgi:DNA-binding GntR family transcriptional regulator
VSPSIKPVPVDRTSPVPLYFQVARHLQQAIETGEIPPGAQLENEIQLAADLGLSRPTMRRAMQYLVERGLLVRKRGIGTQVVRAKVKRAVELSSLWEDLVGSGQKPTTTVLSNESQPAVGELASKLAVPEGTLVIALERLRYASGEPLARMVNYLPASLVSPLSTEVLQEQGLYQVLRASGITLHAAAQTIGARSATTAEARLLDETKGAPLLTMERITYDDRGQVIEYGTHIYRSSRYSFEISLLAQLLGHRKVRGRPAEGSCRPCRPERRHRSRRRLARGYSPG